MAIHIQRRALIVPVGDAAACPLAARAQRRERMRRIGTLITTAANDPAGQARLAAFLRELEIGKTRVTVIPTRPYWPGSRSPTHATAAPWRRRE